MPCGAAASIQLPLWGLAGMAGFPGNLYDQRLATYLFSDHLCLKTKSRLVAPDLPLQQLTVSPCMLIGYVNTMLHMARLKPENSTAKNTARTPKAQSSSNTLSSN